jgi:hypothetical protein
VLCAWQRRTGSGSHPHRKSMRKLSSMGRLFPSISQSSQAVKVVSANLIRALRFCFQGAQILYLDGCGRARISVTGSILCPNLTRKSPCHSMTCLVFQEITPDIYMYVLD